MITVSPTHASKGGVILVTLNTVGGTLYVKPAWEAVPAGFVTETLPETAEAGTTAVI
jgi:hypothetical protein